MFTKHAAGEDAGDVEADVAEPTTLSTILFDLILDNPMITPEDAAHDVLSRLLGPRASDFVFQGIPEDDGLDSFTMEAQNGKVHIGGSSAVAMARGAYDYLRRACGAHVSWEGMRLPVPEHWPNAELTRVTAPYRFRQNFNACTIGYTTAWWDWARWEKELDWMALRGINMPLAMVGQEAISRRVWQSLGLTDGDLADFYSGPAFLPWQRMGNIGAHDGPLTISWIEAQCNLQHQILDRARTLEMTPILPAFSGFVPPALAREFPDARTFVSSGWNVFAPTPLLHPSDPLFIDIGRRFLQEYQREYGVDHYYLADTFNEMTPPVREETKLDELAQMGEGVYRSIQAGDPDGVWLMQGCRCSWTNLFWGEAEDLRRCSAACRTSVCCCWTWGCDITEEPGEPSRNSRPPTVGARYGAQLRPLDGDGRRSGEICGASSRRPAGSRPWPAQRHGHLPGGPGAESRRLYELLTDLMWDSQPVDLGAWLQGYCARRYGSRLPQADDAWALLSSSYIVYSDRLRFDLLTYQDRPRMEKTTEPLSDAWKLADAARMLLTCASKLTVTDLLCRDIVDVLKQYLGECATLCIARIGAAHARQDSPTLAALSAQLLGLLTDLDRLVATRQEYHLSLWIAAARRLGNSADEADYYEQNARAQLTTWCSPESYRDYARKEWSGLISGYYRERWRIYLEAIIGAKSFDADAINAQLIAFEEAWANSKVPPLESPQADTLTVAREMLGKYGTWYEYGRSGGKIHSENQ